jgi:hypothetical protein
MGLHNICSNILLKKHKLIVNDQKITENIKLHELHSKYKQNNILDIYFDINESEVVED